MRLTLSIAVLISLAVLVSGCGPGAQESDPAAEAAQQAEDVAAITSAFDEAVAALHAGDAAALAAFFTEDAIRMAPNQPADIGREAIQSIFETVFDQFTLKLTAQTEEVEVAGDWAFARLNYTETATPKAGGEPIEDNAKWLMIFRRGPDGSWKVSHEIWNSDNPLPGTE